MDARERVMRVLHHQEADRVPIDLGGAACSLTDEAYFRLKRYFGIKEDIAPFRRHSTSTYYDERILNRLGIDFRRIMLPGRPRKEESGDQMHFVNLWGVRHVWNGDFCSPCETPLKEADLEALDTYPWPKAEDYFCMDGLEETAKRLYENSSYALVARMPCWGLFDIAHQLRGMESFFIDMLEEPEFAHRLVDKILQCELDIYGAFLDRVGPYVQIVETCDDYGSQTGPMFSRELFQEFFKPARTRLNQFIHEKAPDAKIFLHCCGGIASFLPDIIDTGVEILNPIQPGAAGMDPKILKETYGDSLVFHGCIDTQRALRGSVEDTRKEVKEKVATLYHKGGYIVAPANHIMRDVPPENIIAMYQAATEL